MCRILIVLVATLALVLASPDGKCLKLSDPHMTKCCKSLPALSKEELEMIKECFGPDEKASSPTSCEAEICLAKKNGVVSDDGVIDKKAFEANVEKDFGSNSELVKAMKNHCVFGDISKYGAKDVCDLIKIKHCMLSQIIMSCADLDNSGSCSGLKDLAKECWN